MFQFNNEDLKLPMIEKYGEETGSLLYYVCMEVDALRDALNMYANLFQAKQNYDLLHKTDKSFVRIFESSLWDSMLLRLSRLYEDKQVNKKASGEVGDVHDKGYVSIKHLNRLLNRNGRISTVAHEAYLKLGNCMKKVSNFRHRNIAHNSYRFTEGTSNYVPDVSYNDVREALGFLDEYLGEVWGSHYGHSQNLCDLILRVSNSRINDSSPVILDYHDELVPGAYLIKCLNRVDLTNNTSPAVDHLASS